MAASAAENRNTEAMQALGLAVGMGGTELDKIGAAPGSTTAKRDYRRENAALKATLEH